MSILVPSVAKFPDETYKCNSCKICFDIEDIQMNWKCSGCSKVITIYAITEEGRKVMINRIHPSNLKRGEHIYITKKLSLPPCEVMKVTAMGDGKIKASLKGNGAVDFAHIQYINRYEGTW